MAEVYMEINSNEPQKMTERLLSVTKNFLSWCFKSTWSSWSSDFSTVFSLRVLQV